MSTLEESYTHGMKTAVSIPDDVFQEAERLAQHLGWSRSRLYTEAVRDYLARNEEDPVTAALNAVADDWNEELLPNIGRQLIESGEWEW